MSRCGSTNNAHDASSMQIVLTGTCSINERLKNSQRYFVQELVAGKRLLQLHYWDVFKQDMNELNIDLNNWEELAKDRSR